MSETVSLTESAYEEIKGLILHGAFAPNAQVDEKSTS